MQAGSLRLMPKIRIEDGIERIIFSARIDKNLQKKIKQIAIDEERDMYDVTEEAFRDYIAKKEKQKLKKVKKQPKRRS